MKILDIINEGKQPEPQKPRNFVAKNSKMGMGGAGAHKDKKKAEKQGDVKHKKQTVPLDEISRGDYYKKATMDKAMNQMSAGFAKSPEEREQHLQKAGRRERGLARAKVRTDKFWAEKNAKDQADALERDRARKPEMIAQLKDLEAKFDPSYEYSDDYSEWHKHKQIANQIGALKQRLSQLDETATAGATNAGSIGTVVNPHHSPGKARGKKSYLGSPSTGSGTKAPPQPKVKQPKTSSGTAVNGLDIKGASLFGGPALKR